MVFSRRVLLALSLYYHFQGVEGRRHVSGHFVHFPFPLEGLLPLPLEGLITPPLSLSGRIHLPLESRNPLSHEGHISLSLLREGQIPLSPREGRTPLPREGRIPFCLSFSLEGRTPRRIPLCLSFSLEGRIPLSLSRSVSFSGLPLPLQICPKPDALSLIIRGLRTI